MRITVQLIKADDGTHLWSENYDRQLTDTFAIQEDIARTVTASLNMSLGLRPGENLVSNRGIDTDSYEKYLRARALIMGRGGVPTDVANRSFAEAITLLEPIVAKNPDYAPALAMLGSAYGVLASNNAVNESIADPRASVDELRTKGETALKKAIQLDPSMGDAYAVLGWFARSRGQMIEAKELEDKALTLNPLSSVALFISSMSSVSAGNLMDGLEFAERGHSVDPLYPNLAEFTVEDRWLNGQTESAIALAKMLRTGDRARLLAIIYASIGRYDEAADALMELAAGNPSAAEAQVARQLRAGQVTTTSSDALPRLQGDLAPLYLFLGAPERVLQPYERRAEVGFVSGNRGYVWHPDYAPVRKTERFKVLMRKVGLVDYWRVKGWPEFCRPVGADDFACN